MRQGYGLLPWGTDQVLRAHTAGLCVSMRSKAPATVDHAHQLPSIPEDN